MINVNKEKSRWLRVSLYYARNDWHKLLSDISIFKEKLKGDISNYIILFSQEKGDNVRLAVSVVDSGKRAKLYNLIDNHFASFVSNNLSISDKVFEYGKSLWRNYENNSVVWDTYDIATATTTETAYLSKTSSVVLRLLEDDFSPDNFYSVSLYLLSKILRNIVPTKRVETVEQIIETYSVEFAQFGEYDFATSDLISQFQISLPDVFEAINSYWAESENEESFLDEWKTFTDRAIKENSSSYTLIDNIFYVLGLSLMERLFILEILHKWLQENRHKSA